MPKGVWSLVIALAALSISSTAQARTSADYAYRFEQVWSAAVRLVRVEMGCPLHEKDEEVGFVLFDYQDGPRAYPASVELLRTRVDGEARVRVVLQIPAMPSYIEQMILDRLGRKLIAEFGEPPAPTPRPAREAPPGGGEGAPPGDQNGPQDGSRTRGPQGSPSSPRQQGSSASRPTNRR